MLIEAVIGLEIHAQLLTRTKIFCGCSTRFGDPPNTNVCPVCLGLPGALPVLNSSAVEHATRASLALGCTVHERSVFARKNYFYPDLPKGYQITQYDRPLATGGLLEVQTAEGPRQVGIVRVHLEEDAGKSLHDGFPDSDRYSYVDFNRSGIPLIEIVSRPDMRTAAEAAAFFQQLREVLVAIGVNDGNMEEGSLRCDANVSVRRQGDETLGVKTELKNINSFRHVQRAIDYEIARQSALLDAGQQVAAETRLWDVVAGRTQVMRSKEEAHDYRYFPEPDLPPLVLEGAWIAGVRRSLPELPDQTRRRLVSQYGLPEYDAGVLTQAPGVAAYFEAVAAASGNPKAASNWVMGDVIATLNERRETIDRVGISAQALGGLIRLVQSGTISGPIAKDVFGKMYGTGLAAEAIVTSEGLARIDDEGALEQTVREVLAAHPRPVAQYRAGSPRTLGFLVGQVMKATAGRANPEIVNRLVRRELEKDPA